MTARHFADTNLLVYAVDEVDPEKHRRASEWMTFLWENGSGCVSTQVLSEYYAVTTRKLDPGLAEEEARAHIRDLASWRTVGASIELLKEAWQVEDRYTLSWWDSLVIAAAKTAQCDVLLTEDLQHGQDLDGLIVIDPLQLSPSEVT